MSLTTRPIASVSKEPVVPEWRLHHIEFHAEVVGDLLLQVDRIEPVRWDPNHTRRNLQLAQDLRPAAAIHIVQGHCVGQCHIGPRVEAEIQLVRLMVQVGLHGGTARRQGVLPELVIAAEPTRRVHVRCGTSDGRSCARFPCRSAVQCPRRRVACAPVGVGWIAAIWMFWVAI